MESTVSKWANEVPEDFKFTFKLFREITHNKDLVFDADAVRHFMKVISASGEKKGCLLIQFPASVRLANLRQLILLMDVLRGCDPDQNWKMAMEFRHISLYHEDVYRFLHEYRIALVIQDMPPAITPIEDMDMPFVYLRFHGPDGNYKGSYEDSLLSEYASYIRDWVTEGKIVYSYFNNTMGAAVNNLFRLNDLVDI